MGIAGLTVSADGTATTATAATTTVYYYLTFVIRLATVNIIIAELNGGVRSLAKGDGPA